MPRSSANATPCQAVIHPCTGQGTPSTVNESTTPCSEYYVQQTFCTRELGRSSTLAIITPGRCIAQYPPPCGI